MQSLLFVTFDVIQDHTKYLMFNAKECIGRAVHYHDSICMEGQVGVKFKANPKTIVYAV